MKPGSQTSWPTSTHSNVKKRPQVSRRSPRVRGKTPLCRAMMTRPPQQKRFFPGKTSHLLLGLLRSSLPSRAGGVGAGVARARGSICSYSQLSMLEFGSVPVRTSGACAQHPTPPRHSAAVAIPRKNLLTEGGPHVNKPFQKRGYLSVPPLAWFREDSAAVSIQRSRKPKNHRC